MGACVDLIEEDGNIDNINDNFMAYANKYSDAETDFMVTYDGTLKCVNQVDNSLANLLYNKYNNYGQPMLLQPISLDEMYDVVNMNPYAPEMINKESMNLFTTAPGSIAYKAVYL